MSSSSSVPPSVNPFYIEPNANRDDYYIDEQDLGWDDNDVDSDLDELLEHNVMSADYRRRRRRAAYDEDYGSFGTISQYKDKVCCTDSHYGNFNHFRQ